MDARLIRGGKSLALCFGVAAAGLLAGSRVSSEERPNARAAAVKEFSDRAERYARLNRELAGKLPGLPEKAEPEQITAHQKALAQVMRARRADARQGEIFHPEVVPVFLELLRADLGGAAGRDAREAIKEGNPRVEKPQARPGEPKPKPVVLQANAPYPEGAPLSTVPPDLLAKLPKLPEPLEYRFVGGHLILYDSEASLVVDFLKEVVA
jgi:hypothetical protein